MQIGRRQFLKYCIGSAAALGLPMTVVGKLEQALAASGIELPTVIWLNGANCTGCTVSLANYFSSQAPTDVADLLVNTINLAFHPNLMGAAGDLAVAKLHESMSENFILAIDGGIPTAFGGRCCYLWSEIGHEVTAQEAISLLAPQAAAVLCIGTCSSFGGIPGGYPNPTDIKSVSEITGLSTINIPGCPTHPDWIVWTIAQLLTGSIPHLDRDGRPYEFFGGERRLIHERCPYEDRKEADTFGEHHRCLKELGCKGEKTKGDCPTRKWNNRTSWCVEAGAICIGCTENGFPDNFTPFFREGEDDEDHEEEDD
jgi:hydrogenase small subunit